jgi:hypothetical protein
MPFVDNRSQYLVTDHYWIVLSRPGEVYSSARRIFVPDTDAQYLAFLALPFTFTTTIATEALLRSALNDVGVPYLNEPLPPLMEDRPRIARARVRLVASSFPTTSGTPRSIPWSSAPVDPLGMWSASPNPDRVTILQPGIYSFTLGIRFTEGTRTGERAVQLGLGLGGTPIDLGTMRLSPALAGDTSFGFTEYAGAPTPLAVGDILRGFVSQTSGGAINCVARLTLVREE